VKRGSLRLVALLWALGTAVSAALVDVGHVVAARAVATPHVAQQNGIAPF